MFVLWASTSRRQKASCLRSLLGYISVCRGAHHPCYGCGAAIASRKRRQGTRSDNHALIGPKSNLLTSSRRAKLTSGEAGKSFLLPTKRRKRIGEDIRPSSISHGHLVRGLVGNWDFVIFVVDFVLLGRSHSSPSLLGITPMKCMR